MLQREVLRARASTFLELMAATVALVALGMWVGAMLL